MITNNTRRILRNLEMTENIELSYPPEKLGNQDNRQISQILRETKTDKMCNLRREIEFLGRGMQRVRIKLNRSQDLIQMPSTSIAGI